MKILISNILIIWECPKCHYVEHSNFDDAIAVNIICPVCADIRNKEVALNYHKEAQLTSRRNQ